MAAALAACGQPPRKVGEQPSWRTSSGAQRFAAQDGSVQEGPFVFAPAAAPAQSYNQRTSAPPPSTPIGDAIWGAVQDAAALTSTTAPVRDPRLYAVAEDLAKVVPEEGIVAYALVEFALQHHGIIEPSPHLLVVWGPLDSAQAIVDQLAPRIPEILRDAGGGRVGIGSAVRSSNGDGVAILAVQGSSVVTSPIPRALPAGGRAVVEGRVLPPFRGAEVFVTRDDGNVERLTSQLRGGEAFRAELDCGARRGKQQVEVTAHDVTGSTVLANFPVWCAEPAPATLTVVQRRGEGWAASEAEAERGLFDLLNRDRRAAGLAPLEWDDRVAAVGRGHSAEMKSTGVVAHLSPLTGSAADRVHAAGLRSAAVLENVARAYGVGEAHDGLMNSPGHRANLLSSLVTHVGIGVVFGEEVSGQREMFVTQVFTRVLPRIDVARASVEVRDRVKQAGQVGDDPVLDQVAAQWAADLAQGMTHPQARELAFRRLGNRAQRYSRVGSVITAVSDLAAVSGASLLGESRATHVGVGVAQGKHPEIGDGALWIVLLVAETT